MAIRKIKTPKNTSSLTEGGIDLAPPALPGSPRDKLRRAVRNFYDIQKMRVASGNRNKTDTVVLDEADLEFLDAMSSGLKAVEATALREVARLLKGMAIWEEWLMHQRGIGPTMAGVLVSWIDIDKADTVSKIWAYAGLHTVAVEGQEGVRKAPRPTRGQFAGFNPWLRSKLVKVMGDNLIKSVGLDERGYYTSKNARNPAWDQKGKDSVALRLDWDEAIPPIPEHVKTVSIKRTLEPGFVPWRKCYDDYKARKQNQLVPICMGCEGTGRFSSAAAKHEPEFEPEEGDSQLELTDKEKAAAARGVCSNCEGRGRNAPWGRSAAHRHQAAVRYMVKMFLIEFHKQWRQLKGLPVRPPYREEYLGLPPHSGPMPGAVRKAYQDGPLEVDEGSAPEAPSSKTLGLKGRRRKRDSQPPASV